MLKILIDGDSCSKIDDTIHIAKKHDIPVHIYKDYDHELSNDYAEIHTVEVGSDSADFAIANNTDAGDIVVTNDTGLASTSTEPFLCTTFCASSSSMLSGRASSVCILFLNFCKSIKSFLSSRYSHV